MTFDKWCAQFDGNKRSRLNGIELRIARESWDAAIKAAEEQEAKMSTADEPRPVEGIVMRLNDILADWATAQNSHALQARMIADQTGRTDTRAAGYADMLQSCINEIEAVLHNAEVSRDER